jgi:hypothetical protein
LALFSFDHIHMIRSVVALLIAPLCVPLVVASHDLLLTFQHRDHPNIHYLTVFPLIVFAVISYGSTFLLGVPMLVFVRWLGFSDWWAAGVIGFFIGAALWVGAAIWYLIAHGGVDISLLARQVVILGLPYFFSWPSGALGAAVGVTFWLIARPDCRSQRANHTAP